MKLGIGSDHWGIGLKSGLFEYLTAHGIQVVDFGTRTAEPIDYPDIAQAVAEAVANGIVNCGILICKTGLGMAIVANKIPGIYAATVHNLETARAAAASNMANIITLGSESLTLREACAIVSEWLQTPFKGGQSAFKIEKIHLLESKYYNGYRPQQAR